MSASRRTFSVRPALADAENFLISDTILSFDGGAEFTAMEKFTSRQASKFSGNTIGPQLVRPSTITAQPQAMASRADLPDAKTMSYSGSEISGRSIRL